MKPQKIDPISQVHHKKRRVAISWILPLLLLLLLLTLAAVEAQPIHMGQSGTVTLPSTANGRPVTRIRPHAYQYSTGLTDVAIAEGVTGIENGAFWYCTSLRSITIPNSVRTIGGNAFYGCSKLASIIIPDSVTSIEATTFGSCTSLTNVTIGSGVTNIGIGAFEKCIRLTDIYLRGNAPSLAVGVFASDGDPTVHYAPGVTHYAGTEGHLPPDQLKPQPARVWDGIARSPQMPGQENRFIGIGVTNVTTNSLVRVIIQVGTEVPEKIAISLNPDFSKATWIACTNQVLLDLGPEEGGRMIYAAAQWGGANTMVSISTSVLLEYTAPAIFITNPKQLVISRPFLDLQGYTPKALSKIRYDVVNASNRVVDAQGVVNAAHYDFRRFETTTNFFTCYDIELAPGTNLISVRCTDQAGNTGTTNVTVVFSLEGATNPPAMSLVWPQHGMLVTGGTLTVQGNLNDDAAKVAAEIAVDGKTNRAEGLVERGGQFWVKNLPFAGRANHLRLVATDAAGNSAGTNIMVYHNDTQITIDPVSQEQLRYAYATVTGSVKPAGYDVWINGVKGTVAPDGKWVAKMVPLNEGGTVSFYAMSTPRSPTEAKPGQTNVVSGPSEAVYVQATAGVNPAVLNTGHPACGPFILHLADTEGKSFILYASTNLSDWAPILTNRNSKPTFDYVDDNAASYRCRFFKLVPLP